MGIVVAWNQVPLNGLGCTHPLDRLPQRPVTRGFNIIDIAGDKNVPHPLRERYGADPGNGVQALIPKHLACLVGKAESCADMPI
jgi:hypothetical protein